jgi:site-specific DNA-cytosine methylase
VETVWAIEFEEAAAKAFAVNFPESTVFNEDCNDILALMIAGEHENAYLLLATSNDCD